MAKLLGAQGTSFEAAFVQQALFLWCPLGNRLQAFTLPPSPSPQPQQGCQPLKVPGLGMQGSGTMQTMHLSKLLYPHPHEL